jgi:hypothetical protein
MAPCIHLRALSLSVRNAERYCARMMSRVGDGSTCSCRWTFDSFPRSKADAMHMGYNIYGIRRFSYRTSSRRFFIHYFVEILNNKRDIAECTIHKLYLYSLIEANPKNLLSEQKFVRRICRQEKEMPTPLSPLIPVQGSSFLNYLSIVVPLLNRS